MKKNDTHFVLIRGLIRETRHWSVFPEHLKQHFPNAIVHTPEVPGNGRLYHLSSPTNIAAMTDSIRQQVSIPKNITLIGISMGGMIAIDWMNRYPEEIDAAVLINTSVRPLSPFYQRLRWQIYPAILKILLSSKTNREQKILALTSNRYAHNSNVLRSWTQWQQQYPITGKNAIHQLVAAAKFSISQKPSQPILIVTSCADRLVDYRCSQQLSLHWKSDFLKHHSAGHDLSLDEPKWLAAEIQHWHAMLNQ